MYTIEAKLTDGRTFDFNDLTDLFMWCAQQGYEPSENGWEEINEYCERRVAYAADDEPGQPSCELLVQSEISGAAHEYCDASDNDEEFISFGSKRDFVSWIVDSLGSEGSRELANKIFDYLWETAEHIGMPEYGKNWARFLNGFDGWNLLKAIEDMEAEKCKS